MSGKSLLTPEQHQFLYDEYHAFFVKAQLDTEKYHLHDFFEILRGKNDDFKKFSDKELSNKIIASRRLDGSEEWPNLSDIEDYINPQVRSLIEKAHNSALLAVEIYNKPLISYRTEGFIVMMMIAWTGLFHAIFQKQGVSIKYKNGTEEDYLDLGKCIRKYEGQLKKEIEANLTLLIKIRDRIVHRENTKLDDRLFGHCQSCLLNFEELLVSNFGERYQLPNSLAFSLQFSKKYQPQQLDANKKYRNRHDYKILDFIEEYEKDLFGTEPEIYKSLSYCFRIYMIPKIVKENKAEAAIEYIRYDSLEPDAIEKFNKAILFIKETRVGGEYFKAGAVCKIVYDRLKNIKGANWKFTASYHHAKCANYFKIREGYKTDNPDNTKKEYCYYDHTFKQYIYTQQWINFLLNKLKNDVLYSEILKS
jgi:hypothetical protein